MPNIFGFKTPEETAEEIRQKQQIFIANTSNNARSSAERLGVALGGLLGRKTRKFLDTREARKEEVASLLAAGNLTEDEAKKMAKASVTPEYAEVRKARRIEEVTSGGQNIMQELISQGMPARKAQALGMLDVSRRMEKMGMRNESTALAMQARTLFEEQEKLDKEAEVDAANLAKLKMETNNIEVDNLRADQAEARLGSAAERAEVAALRSEQRAQAEEERKKRDEMAQDDTFIKFTDEGGVEDMKSVSMLNVEEREALRAAGYINTGNSALGIGLAGVEAFPPTKKTVSPEVMDDVAAGLSMMSSFRVLRAAEPMTGVLEGPARGLAARFGLGAGEFIDAVAVSDKYYADVQSIIKGIPSNYDAKVFSKIVPDPRKFESPALYSARLDLLEGETQRMLELVIAFHKGTNQEFPQPVIDAMKYYGIDSEKITPIGEPEFAQATKAHQRVLEAHAANADEENNTIVSPKGYKGTIGTPVLVGE